MTVTATGGDCSCLLEEEPPDPEPPEEKVTICHKGNTIEVAESAVQAHLDHGDTLGPCEEEIVRISEEIEYLDVPEA